MGEEDYLFFKTFYDINIFRQAAAFLKREGIDFKIVDKSSQINYRVPLSTFTEIELHVKKDNFEKTESILQTFLP